MTHPKPTPEPTFCQIILAGAGILSLFSAAPGMALVFAGLTYYCRNEENNHETN